jgi:hypothetical protein
MLQKVLGWSGLVVLAAAACAQERTGAISGRVLDQSGAAISGAQLKLQSTATGLERETLSGAEGEFGFPLVPVGPYRIVASKTDFQQLIRDGIRVDVAQNARIDLTLAVASAESSVSIVEDAPQVDTATSANGVVVGERQIRELPLNGRNFTQLGTLLPGALPQPARYETQFQSLNLGFAINGQRSQSNNFLLDGVTNSDLIFTGYVLTPPPDSLEQFRILTGSFAAEYGVQSGSVVNVITKSGSNQFHGSAWNFLRNDALDARNFFSTSKPSLRQNQYGGTLGGPIHKDRTFVFGYFEGLRTREGTVQNVVVLSEAQRQGNLSGTLPPPRDPLTGQPFPNAQIPAARIHPIARSLLDTYVPLPNQAGNRYNRAPSISTDGEQFGIRADHRISERNSLFGRYSYSQSKTSNPLAAGSFSPAGSSSEIYNHSAVISDTHAFAPNLLNEASISFLRSFGRPATWSGLDLSEAGFRYPATEPSANGLPFVALSGLFSIGDVQQSWTKLARNTYQVFDNVTWIRGRHTLKTGMDIRRQQIYLVFPNRPNGDFSFTGERSANVISDFLLGTSAQFRQGGGDPAKHFIGTSTGFYLQDDWKVTRKLTLNIGLRYELALPYYDKQDRVASFQPGRKSTVRPTAPEGLLYPGDAGVPRATIATDKNNLAPRFGFAYDVFGNGRTSIRGGYGIFYDATPGVAAFQNINVAPFNRFVQLDAPFAFENPYAGLPTNPQTDPRGDFPCPCLVIGFAPDFRSAYAQHFHFGVQQQVAKDLMWEANYVGSVGTRLPAYLEINPAIPGPGATLANTQQRRIYKDYNLVRPTLSIFNSNYHSLQTRLDRRYSNGLSFLLSYTWSKAIDYQSAVNLNGEVRPQDAISLSDVRGLAAFDLRHRFVGSFGYEVPWLRRNRLFGGWQVLGIVAAQSGNPLTVTEPVDLSLRGLRADRPDQVSDPNGGPKTPERWFHTAAFVRLPAVAGGQRSGTAGRNTVISPGILQTDLSVRKLFAVTERHKLEFRTEFFNALNRANLLSPGTSIGAPQTFGVVQSARPARIIQLALKYSF